MRTIRTGAALSALILAAATTLAPATATQTTPGLRQPPPGAHQLSGSSAVATTATATRAAIEHALGVALGRTPSSSTGSSVDLVVRASTSAAAATVSAAAHDRGLPTTSGLERLGYVSISVPGASVAAATTALEASPGVVSVTPAPLRSLYLTPNDPLFATGQSAEYAAVHGPAAWDVATGAGVTIAVLDSGFDVTHPDLAGKVSSTWDVVTSTADVGYSLADSYPGHGTAMASIAAAATNNGIGLAGAAPDAALMLVQVADANALVYADAVAAGIVYATDHGAAVISMSFGSPASAPVEQSAVAYALARGVVVVAAAGNDTGATPMYPAALPGVIAVGATLNDGSAAAPFSNYGQWVSVGAPGVDVTAALPIALDTTDGTQDGYTVISGTSPAAPIVAGEAALLVQHAATSPQSTVASTIAAATDGNAALRFAHGLVKFDAALAALPAGTALTTPPDGSTVSGDVAVAASSGAPSVRFVLMGTTIAAVAPVSGGLAAATLPTYGLSGPATIRAYGCDSGGCGAKGSEAAVTIANPSPVLTAPFPGAVISTAFTASATSPGGAVRFLVDTVTAVGLDNVAPYSVVVDTATIADGMHTVTAVQCSTDGSYCDTGHPSLGVTISVQRLRPTLSASPSSFSPNGDKRLDVTRFFYGLDQPQTVVLRIYSPAGAVVRGPLTLGVMMPAGRYSWVWDGKNNAKVLAPNGTYKAELSTSRLFNAGQPTAATVVGVVSTSVRSDRANPVVSSVTASPKTFFPVKDGYLDTAFLGAKSNEALSLVVVIVTTLKGVKIRTLSATASPAGRVGVTWDGRTSSRAAVPAGTYRYQLQAQDLAGNRTLSVLGLVVVSPKHLVAHVGTATLAPRTSVRNTYIGACSEIFYNVRKAWPQALGYYSDFLCTNGSPDDLAAASHSFTLPAAVKYGKVRVSALGGSATNDPDQAGLLYFDRSQTLTSVGTPLLAPDATYAAPMVDASTYLVGGRTLLWLVGTINVNWYDVGSFTVTWTYYVLT